MATFLILGGTGKVGRRISELLDRHGHVVRPASRSGSTRFDWRDRSTWAPALEGVDGVFIVGPGSATDWSPLLSELLQAGSEAGVQQAVLLSARGVEFLPDGAVARAERALQEGRVPWTILRPTHFSQNFTEAMFAPDHGVITAPVGDGAEPFIDVLDIAEVAANVLAEGPESPHARQIVALSGPQAITFAEAAAVLSEVSGQPVTFVPQTVAAHVADLRNASTPEGYLEWRLAMLGGIERGEDAYLSDGVESVLGRPATGFRDWARREVPGASWVRRNATSR
jgi:uncharacterized protein YbjT (DUF2867 family)